MLLPSRRSSSLFTSAFALTPAALALTAFGVVGCSIDTGDLFGDPSDGGSSSGGNPSAGGNGAGGSQADGGAPSSGGSQADGGGTVSGPMCGDGVKNGGEECDAGDFGGLDCTSFGSDDPSGLSCTDTCTLDASQCEKGGQCGNGSVDEEEECDDGNNAGFDGCSATCKSDGTCDAPISVQVAAGTTTITGDTTNGPSALAGAGNSCQGNGPELVLKITATATGVFTAHLPSSAATFDSVLYASDDCPVPQNAICHDNFGTSSGNGGEVLSFPITAGAEFFLVVDGYEPDDAGAFELSLDISSGDDCSDPVPIVIEGDANFTLYGSTTGLADDAAANYQCGSQGAGDDLVYQVQTPEGGSYGFDLTPENNGHNTVLHARSACDDIDEQLACDGPISNNSSQITLSPDAGDMTYVWIDGTTNNQGSYTLQIEN